MRRYTLMEKIGEGGMGLVYRARQEGLDREVALKILRIELSRDRERLKRFEREVAACIKLAHPNIVKILDSGELDGKHYYVMELLLDGRPLDAALKEQGPFAPARAADVAAQVLDALDYAHARGILHRDVKPANVMLRPGGLVTLMDFGLAKDVAATTLLTAPGQSLGTPRYMAPELFEPADVGGAVDVWATGCVLYEMLTGAPPFDGASIMEIAMRVSAGGYVPATRLRLGLPAGTDALIARFLEKVARDRPKTAGEAAELVRAWARGGEAAPRGGEVAARPARWGGPAMASPSMPRAGRADRPRNPEARDTDVDGGAPAMEGAGEATAPMARPGEGAREQAPPRPASRGRGHRRRRAKLATVMAAASLIGLVCGVLLRPSPPPKPPARAAVANVTERSRRG